MIHLARFELEPELEEEFSRWYEAEHAPSTLERSGWRRIRHYRCVEGKPFLSLYELDADLPLQPRLSAAPFRQGPFTARGVRDYHARTWRQVHAAGTPGAKATWVNVVTVEIDERDLEQFNRWYNEVHVPEILACPGWSSNRRFVCLDGESSVLAIYELEDPELAFATPQWESVVGWDEHVEYIRGFHGFRVYELMFEQTDSAGS